MPRYKATSEGNIPFTAAEEEAADKRDADWLLGADDRLAIKHRAFRNNLILQSDWTQVADAPVDATAWATYRQALRDITAHSNWPNLSDDDWPTEPS